MKTIHYLLKFQGIKEITRKALGQAEETIPFRMLSCLSHKWEDKPLYILIVPVYDIIITKIIYGKI